MAAPVSFSELSPGMRRGLLRCHGLVVEVDDERHCGIAPRTLAALLHRGLVEAVRDGRLRLVYRPTAAGLALIAQDEPLFLHRSAGLGYTRRWELALRESVVADATGARRMVPVEAVEPTVLAEFAADAAERRRGEPGRREEELRRRARSLAARLREAVVAVGPDGSGVHLDALERHIAELERARARRAA